MMIIIISVIVIFIIVMKGFAKMSWQSDNKFQLTVGYKNVPLPTLDFRHSCLLPTLEWASARWAA